MAGAMAVTGASAPEELDESVLERLEGLRDHPVRINGPRTRLLSCGLFSAYQVASLLDYRARTGDIRSLQELSLVDGFSPAFVGPLAPFLSLESAAPGADTLAHNTLLRATLNGYAARYRLGSGERWAAGGALKGGYDSKPEGRGALVWNHRKGKVVLGSFNLRVGQGLSLWSGFRLTSLSSLGAFVQKGNGIAPSWSWTTALTGAAADYLVGNVRLSAFAAWKGPVGGRVEWLLRDGAAGATACRDGDRWRAALDARFTLLGADLFGEVAWSGTPASGSGPGRMLDASARAFAAKGGLLLPVGERWKTGLQLRALPTAYTGRKYGEYGAALGLEGRSGRLEALLTLDGALLPVPGVDPRRWQLKLLTQETFQASDGLQFASRLQIKLRSDEPTRTDWRLEALWDSAPLSLKWRGNLVYAGKLGMLTYVEGGWKGRDASAFLRATLFRADDWACRLYSYERDVPGSFSVPAYYGRGLSLSATGGWKWHPARKFTLKANARAACTFNSRKAPAFVLKAQLALAF